MLNCKYEIQKQKHVLCFLGEGVISHQMFFMHSEVTTLDHKNVKHENKQLFTQSLGPFRGLM